MNDLIQESIDTVTPKTSPEEMANKKRRNELFQESPVGDELLSNLQLYMSRQSLMRLFFFKEIYDRILDVPGVIMEFGCKWGKNLALFSNLRGIYEPYNHNRTIIGFDTFNGLKGVSDTDGTSKFVGEGFFSTVDNYRPYLEEVLSCHENESPIAHIKKHLIIEGDVRETLPRYIEANPQTIIAFAYLDMDIYEPTKVALEKIKPFLVKGSVIGFDELNWSEMPGPTLAMREVLYDMSYRIYRSPLQPIPGYLVIE